MKNKIGRNDPCPCGSGKKYKKCCINKQKKESSSFINQNSVNQFNLPPRPEKSPAMRPYVAAKMCDPAGETFKQLKKQRPDFKPVIKDKCFLSDVRSLSTEEIISRLSSSGIEYNQEKFLNKCNSINSSWDVAETLWPVQINSKDAKTSDFTGLAACILWERLHAEGTLRKVSYEMLDDWIEKGYHDFKRGAVGKGIEIWIDVWDSFKNLFDFSEMTIDKLDDQFNGGQSFFNWVQDFKMELLNASIDNKEHAPTGIKYLCAFLDLFKNEDEDLLADFNLTLGELYCRFGNQKKGESVMQQLIDKFPNRAIGYIGMETALSLREMNGQGQAYKEQLEILEEAKEYPVVDGPDWDLDKRINDLKK